MSLVKPDVALRQKRVIGSLEHRYKCRGRTNMAYMSVLLEVSQSEMSLLKLLAHKNLPKLHFRTG